MTIRVSEDTSAKLTKIAEGTKRSKSFLAREAVSAYVERELAIIEGIQRAGRCGGWSRHPARASDGSSPPDNCGSTAQEICSIGARL